MIPVTSEGVIYISLPVLDRVRLRRAISLDRFGLPGSLDVTMVWRRFVCQAWIAPLLSHKLDFPSNIEMDFDSPVPGSPSEFHPLVEGR
jgi:hypothetical protein